MSSSTALLPRTKKDDHPIFLRVSHSPWLIVNQEVLMLARGIIALYMAMVFLLVVYYEMKKTDRGCLIAFEFPNISYLLQVIYHCITFTWTFMHLHYPHHGSASPSTSTRLQKFFSPPRQNPTTENRTYFSIFYTAAVSYPHVVTFAYWLILVPRKPINPEDILDQGFFGPVVIYNKYGVNSVIALIEIIFLSSVKRQEKVWAHIFGLSILSLVYVGWTYIGRLLTGRFVYNFLDFYSTSWENILVAVISFTALQIIFFAVIYGITGLREMFTNAEQGYTSLPQ